MSIHPPLASLGRGAPLRSGDANGRGLLNAVVEEIGHRVLSGRYAVGDTIPIEPVLMEELDISRTVLREALKVLIAKGLLESRPKIGTRVKSRRSWNMLDPTILRLYCRSADYSDFAGHFQQLRFIIEPEAAALAAFNRTDAQQEAIASAYEAMKESETVHEWTEADLAFHQAILEATGNPFLVPLGSLIHTALETLLYQSADSAPDPFESLGGHHRVLSAIGEQDAEVAREAMKDLLGHTSLVVSRVIEVGQAPKRGTRLKRKDKTPA